MALSAVKNWIGRHMPLDLREPDLIPLSALTLPEIVLPNLSRPAPTWSADRLATTDGLWGDGYQFPGGEIETLRLAKPLGLSAASSLLMLGVGAGGAACSVATQL